MEVNGSWITYLDEVVQKYNSSLHSTIRSLPSRVMRVLTEPDDNTLSPSRLNKARAEKAALRAHVRENIQRNAKRMIKKKRIIRKQIHVGDIIKVKRHKLEKGYKNVSFPYEATVHKISTNNRYFELIWRSEPPPGETSIGCVSSSKFRRNEVKLVTKKLLANEEVEKNYTEKNKLDNIFISCSEIMQSSSHSEVGVSMGGSKSSNSSDSSSLSSSSLGSSLLGNLSLGSSFTGCSSSGGSISGDLKVAERKLDTINPTPIRIRNSRKRNK